MSTFLFTSECVGEGHPDKVADSISDIVVDNLLAYDHNSRVAVETMVTTGQVMAAGEVSSHTYIDLQDVIRNRINQIGYTKTDYGFSGDSCGVLNAIHEQSPDIAQGVDNSDIDNQGAGDIGIMFGYAVNETDTYMPLTHYLASMIVRTLDHIRHKHEVMTYLRPDSKAQVTVEYDSESKKPLRIDNVVVCTQHDEFADTDKLMQEQIANDIRTYVFGEMKKEISIDWVCQQLDTVQLAVNPTGRFVIGGPTGDTGLTGRKIIVDTYGGRGASGGGAFSGKDSSKVDRSAAYYTRYIAKNIVAAGIADECLIQVSYAIGQAKPKSIYVNTYGRSHVKLNDSDIAKKLKETFDFRPKSIERTLKLRQPMFLETSVYGHMGRKNEIVQKIFHNRYEGDKAMAVELFTWEKLDLVNKLKNIFNIK